MCALRFRILSQCRSAFTNFGLSAPFLSALEEAKLVNPTPVQKLVIPKILRGESIIFGAQTGILFASFHRLTRDRHWKDASLPPSADAEVKERRNREH